MSFLIGRREITGPSPRLFITTIIALAVVTFASLAGCSPRTPAQKPTAATPTAAIPHTGSSTSCTSPASPTVSLTEGPYFKAGSPERASILETGMKGTKLVLSGVVLTSDCSPAAHALLDFWQANADGQYDNSGFTLRGHQYTDASGHYELTTIIPGLYPGRTEHIHVKVQPPGGPVLTTQLFFSGMPENETDGIFDPSLVLDLQPAADGMKAEFNFIVSTH